jgi:hypothetical protein
VRVHAKRIVVTEINGVQTDFELQTSKVRSRTDPSPPN